MPYGAREYKQRKRNLIEEKNIVIMPSFPILSTIISKKGEGLVSALGTHL